MSVIAQLLASLPLPHRRWLCNVRCSEISCSSRALSISHISNLVSIMQLAIARLHCIIVYILCMLVLYVCLCIMLFAVAVRYAMAVVSDIYIRVFILINNLRHVTTHNYNIFTERKSVSEWERENEIRWLAHCQSKCSIRIVYNIQCVLCCPLRCRGCCRCCCCTASVWLTQLPN